MNQCKNIPNSQDKHKQNFKKKKKGKDEAVLDEPEDNLDKSSPIKADCSLPKITLQSPVRVRDYFFESSMDEDEVTIVSPQLLPAKRRRSSAREPDGQPGKRMKLQKSRKNAADNSEEEMMTAAASKVRKVCQLCGKEFSENAFRRHASIDHEFVCQEANCTLRFSIKKELETHRREVHYLLNTRSRKTPEFRYLCEICNKPMKSPHLLTRHMHEKHSQQTNYPILDQVNRQHSGEDCVETRPLVQQSEVGEVTESTNDDSSVEILECEQTSAEDRLTEKIRIRLPAADGQMTEEEIVQCLRCQDYFDPAGITSHLGKAHKTSCPVPACPLVFVSLRQMMCHRAYRHQREPGSTQGLRHCPTCRLYQDVKGWTQHQLRGHTLTCCHRCEARFATAYDRVLHMAMTHLAVDDGGGDQQAMERQPSASLISLTRHNTVVTPPIRLRRQSRQSAGSGKRDSLSLTDEGSSKEFEKVNSSKTTKPSWTEEQAVKIIPIRRTSTSSESNRPTSNPSSVGDNARLAQVENLEVNSEPKPAKRARGRPPKNRGKIPSEHVIASNASVVGTEATVRQDMRNNFRSEGVVMSTNVSVKTEETDEQTVPKRFNRGSDIVITSNVTVDFETTRQEEIPKRSGRGKVKRESVITSNVPVDIKSTKRHEVRKKSNRGKRLSESLVTTSNIPDQIESTTGQEEVPKQSNQDIVRSESVITTHAQVAKETTKEDSEIRDVRKGRSKQQKPSGRRKRIKSSDVETCQVKSVIESVAVMVCSESMYPRERVKQALFDESRPRHEGLTDMDESVKQELPNMDESVKEVLSDMEESVKEVLPDMDESVKEVLNRTVDEVVELTPEYIVPDLPDVQGKLVSETEEKSRIQNRKKRPAKDEAFRECTRADTVEEKPMNADILQGSIGCETKERKSLNAKASTKGSEALKPEVKSVNVNPEGGGIVSETQKKKLRNTEVLEDIVDTENDKVESFNNDVLRECAGSKISEIKSIKLTGNINAKDELIKSDTNVSIIEEVTTDAFKVTIEDQTTLEKPAKTKIEMIDTETMEEKCVDTDDLKENAGVPKQNIAKDEAAVVLASSYAESIKVESTNTDASTGINEAQTSEVKSKSDRNQAEEKKYPLLGSLVPYAIDSGSDDESLISSSSLIKSDTTLKEPEIKGNSFKVKTEETLPSELSKGELEIFKVETDCIGSSMDTSQDKIEEKEDICPETDVVKNEFKKDEDLTKDAESKGKLSNESAQVSNDKDLFNTYDFMNDKSKGHTVGPIDLKKIETCEKICKEAPDHLEKEMESFAQLKEKKKKDNMLEDRDTSDHSDKSVCAGSIPFVVDNRASHAMETETNIISDTSLIKALEGSKCAIQSLSDKDEIEKISSKVEAELLSDNKFDDHVSQNKKPIVSDINPIKVSTPQMLKGNESDKFHISRNNAFVCQKKIETLSKNKHIIDIPLLDTQESQNVAKILSEGIPNAGEAILTHGRAEKFYENQPQRGVEIDISENDILIKSQNSSDQIMIRTNLSQVKSKIESFEGNKEKSLPQISLEPEDGTKIERKESITENNFDFPTKDLTEKEEKISWKSSKDKKSSSTGYEKKGRSEKRKEKKCLTTKLPESRKNASIDLMEELFGKDVDSETSAVVDFQSKDVKLNNLARNGEYCQEGQKGETLRKFHARGDPNMPHVLEKPQNTEPMIAELNTSQRDISTDWMIADKSDFDELNEIDIETGRHQQHREGFLPSVLKAQPKQTKYDKVDSDGQKKKLKSDGIRIQFDGKKHLMPLKSLKPNHENKEGAELENVDSKNIASDLLSKNIFFSFTRGNDQDSISKSEHNSLNDPKIEENNVFINDVSKVGEDKVSPMSLDDYKIHADDYPSSLEVNCIKNPKVDKNEENTFSKQEHVKEIFHCLTFGSKKSPREREKAPEQLLSAKHSELVNMKKMEEKIGTFKTRKPIIKEKFELSPSKVLKSTPEGLTGYSTNSSFPKKVAEKLPQGKINAKKLSMKTISSQKGSYIIPKKCISETKNPMNKRYRIPKVNKAPPVRHEADKPVSIEPEKSVSIEAVKSVCIEPKKLVSCEPDRTARNMPDNPAAFDGKSEDLDLLEKIDQLDQQIEREEKELRHSVLTSVTSVNFSVSTRTDTTSTVCNENFPTKPTLVSVSSSASKDKTERNLNDSLESIDAIKKMILETPPDPELEKLTPLSQSSPMRLSKEVDSVASDQADSVENMEQDLGYVDDEQMDSPESVIIDDVPNELGKYSPIRPEEILSEDPTKSVEENIDNISSFIISTNIPSDKEDDEFLSDVDDLLGESEGDDDDNDDNESVTVREAESLSKNVKLVEETSSAAAAARAAHAGDRKLNLVCNLCKFSMKSIGQYNVHIKQDHSKHCRFCDLKFTYDHGLEDHVARDHQLESEVSNIRAFRCHLCYMTMSREKAYQTHMKRTHNVACEHKHCKLVFTNTQLKDKHAKVCHDVKPVKSSTKPAKKHHSPVAVKNAYSNAIIQDSPKKDAKPKDKVKSQKSKKKDRKRGSESKDRPPAVKGIHALGTSSEPKLPIDQGSKSKAPFEDDTVCEQCGVKFEFEEFAKHIDLLHEFECAYAGCGRSFVHEYFLRVHLHNVHGEEAPDPADAPVLSENTKTQVKSSSQNSTEDGEDSFNLMSDISFLDGVLLSKEGEEEHTCFQCMKTFPSLVSLKLHTELHLQNVRTGKISPVGEEKCYQCNKTFDTREKLNDHVKTHTVGLNPQRCHICLEMCDKSTIVKHLQVKHSDSQPARRRPDETTNNKCSLCKTSFTTLVEALKHREVRHDHSCDQCSLSFTTQAELTGHEESQHSGTSSSSCSSASLYFCQQCSLSFHAFSSYEEHRKHMHKFACSEEGCSMVFIHQQALSHHMKEDHHLTFIKVNGSEFKIRLTTERSCINTETSLSADSWISSRSAVDRMKSIMCGELFSTRHELFLDRKEREQCNGMRTSTLYQLSNPGFLGGQGDQDTAIIKRIIDTVFQKNIGKADKRLRRVRSDIGFLYSSLVLFPETFIHKYETLGMSRKDAEDQFLEVHVDKEEWDGLDQELEDRIRESNDQVSDDEWIDHSDISDSED